MTFGVSKEDWSTLGHCRQVMEGLVERGKSTKPRQTNPTTISLPPRRVFRTQNSYATAQLVSGLVDFHATI